MDPNEIEKIFERLKNKNTEFDSFEPLNILEPIEFGFESARYEVWKDGQKIQYDNSYSYMRSLIRKKGNGFSYLDISIESEIVGHYIDDSFPIKLCITQRDRLMLLNVPIDNRNDSRSLGGARVMLEVTGVLNHVPMSERTAQLKKNQPYCCSLFLKNGNINKVTFSINQPETLVEFYLD